MPLPPRPPKYAIYPAIGIARVGDSPEYFIGPDIPDRFLDRLPVFRPPRTRLSQPATYTGGDARDSQGRIRKQAARFRVYEMTWKKYRDRSWVPAEPVKEIQIGGGIELHWAVRVTNAKSFKAYANAGQRRPPPLNQRIRSGATLSMRGSERQAHVLKDLATTDRPNEVSLGTVVMSDEGHLIYIGGDGQCFSNGAPLLTGSGSRFQPGWFDDLCDGTITCEVFQNGTSLGSALPAWVVTAQPAWSYEVPNIVSLYDLARVLAVNAKILGFERKTSFVRDVVPFLRAVHNLRYSSGLARAHSQAGRDVPGPLDELADKSSANGRKRRKKLFSRLAFPVLPPHQYFDSAGTPDEDFENALARKKAPASPKNMPMQWSATVVGTTYWHLSALANEKYTEDYSPSVGVPSHPQFTALTPLEQLDALNRAHMGAMVGGSLMPGVEVGFRVADTSNWMLAFRLDQTKLNPGDLTASLPVPWPAGLALCGDADTPLEWWPASRPILVNILGASPVRWGRKWETLTTAALATVWKGLGFLRRDTRADLYEQERTLP